MPKRKLKGKVVSDKMDKTVVVTVERLFAHPVYKKRVRVIKRYKAHDESGARVGDEVVIEETRPLSRDKHWRVVAIDGRPISEQHTANSKQQEPLAVRRKPKARSFK